MSKTNTSIWDSVDINSLYKNIFSQVGNSIIVINQSGEIIEWNITSEEILGFKQKQVLGEKIWNILDFTDQDRKEKSSSNSDFKQGIHDHLSRKTSTYYKKPLEFIIKKPTGEYSYIRSKLVPITQDSEFYIGIISEDIKEKRLEEDNLREKTQHYDIFFNNNGIGICILNNSGRIIKANYKFSQLTGYSRNEFLLLYFKNLTHPSDLQKEQYLLDKAIKAKQNSYTLNKRIITRDGEIIWVKSIHEISWDQHGDIEQTTVFFINIHKQKKAQRALVESQRRYNYILENASDIICTIDTNKKINFINPSFEKTSGIKISEVLGKDISKFIHPKDIKYVEEKFEEVIENNKASVAEVRILNKLTHISFVEFSLAPISENGIITGILVIGRDISARKKIHEDLRNFNTELKENIETKDKLFSVIAHDLKNPFNILMGYSNLLAENIESFSQNDLKNIATEIQLATENGIHLLKNLLEWSITQTGRLTPKPISLNLSEKIKELTLVLNKLASIKEIKILNQIPEKIEVFADEQMLVSVLRNLISNAIKFTHIKGRITLKSTQDNHFVYIAVQDNGIGIKSEILKNLFNPDSTESTDGTLDEKGTGLGLVICQEFINSWLGEIHVESEVGKGSTFTFSVPKS